MEELVSDRSWPGANVLSTRWRAKRTVKAQWVWDGHPYPAPGRITRGWASLGSSCRGETVSVSPRTGPDDQGGEPHAVPRRRRPTHPVRGGGDVPREPEDGDPMGPGREDLGNPDPRRSPEVPCERDPQVPRACRRGRTGLRQALPPVPTGADENPHSRSISCGRRGGEASRQSPTGVASPPCRVRRANASLCLWLLRAPAPCCGRDRRRSGDLALFRRALCQLSYPAPVGRGSHLAVLTGFEPAASALTGRRALQAAPQDHAAGGRMSVAVVCPQGSSNPRYRLERAAS